MSMVAVTVTLVWSVCRVVSPLCVGSQYMHTCPLTTEAHAVTVEWGVAGSGMLKL